MTVEDKTPRTYSTGNRYASREGMWLMRNLVASFLVSVAFMISAASAQALDFTLQPGFWPDPHRVSFVSGGSVDANRLTDADGRPCTGWINGGPDHVMTLTRPFHGLRMFTESSGDTTMVLHNPATGEIFCDDDSYGNGQPEIDMNYIAAGEWHIYIGSYWRDDMHRYELAITEFSSDFATGGMR